MPDLSNGYDAASEAFVAKRSPTIGVATVRRWARSLPPATTVLDVGCGDGVPVTRTLIEEGLIVSAVDASPGMVAAFRRNFPTTPVTCRTAESLSGVNCQFGAAVAWGLMFLLTPGAQEAVIRNIGDLLERGGRFLFTSPRSAHTWTDVLTGRESVSLGESEYRLALAAAGMKLMTEYDDEGCNHYFEAAKG